jgi:hypothetical protein
MEKKWKAPLKTGSMWETELKWEVGMRKWEVGKGGEEQSASGILQMSARSLVAERLVCSKKKLPLIHGAILD